MQVLIFNALLYIITAAFFYKKDRHFTIRTLIFLLYSIFAIAGIYTIYDGTFFSTFGTYSLTNLDVLPYMANYVIVFVLTFSISNINQTDVYKNIRYFNSRTVKNIEIFVIFISLIYVFMQFEVASILSSYELGEIYQAAHDGDSLINFPSRWMNIAYFRTMQILDILYPVIYLIEFAKLTTGKDTKYSITILLLILIPRIMGCAIMANRGGIIFNTASFVFFMIVFWKDMPQKAKLIFKNGSILFLALIVSYLAAISISRLGDDKAEAGNSVLRYFGEAFPNLGLRVWEVSDRYLLGMRTFPTIYSFFSDIPNIVTNAEGNGMKHIVFEQISGFPIINFKTFYGDLYCEWGPLFPFVIISLYLLFIRFLKNKLKGSIFSLLMTYSVYMALVWGIFNANKICETEVENIVTLFLIGYFLRKIQGRHKEKAL